MVDGGDWVLTMDKVSFREFLIRRSDGYFEMLATAAGDRSSNRKTVTGLTATALDAAAGGAALSPSIVGRRVDALAAHDVPQLVQVSQDWKAPDSLDLSLTSAVTDFYVAAWEAAFRFLWKAGYKVEYDFSRLPLPLQREQATLAGTLAPEIRSWSDVVRIVAEERASYAIIRSINIARVCKEGEIGHAHLKALLETDVPELVPLARLRIFTPAAFLLSMEASEYLRQLFEARWFSMVEPDVNGTGGEEAILLELVTKLGMSDELWSRAAQHLLQRLDEHGAAGNWAPFAYLLLNKDWTCR